MNKGLLGTSVLIGALGLVGCGIETQGSNGEAIGPDQQSGSTTKGDGVGLDIYQVSDATVECHVDACFEITAEQALDYVGIGGDIDASAVTLFAVDELGLAAPLDLELELLVDLSVALGSGECSELLPDECLGIKLAEILATTNLMVCIELDATAEIPEIAGDATVDIDVFASAESTCYAESFSLEVDAHCTVEGDGSGDCEGYDCGGGDGGEGDECTLGEVLCDGLCVDLEVDLLNCGVCGNVCEFGECVLGECVL